MGKDEADRQVVLSLEEMFWARDSLMGPLMSADAESIATSKHHGTGNSSNFPMQLGKLEMQGRD